MSDKQVIEKILIKFHEKGVLELPENDFFKEIEITKTDLLKINDFKKYFYFNNFKLRLRSSLRIGYIQKGKLTDFLVTPQGDTRLVYKALAINGDLILMDLLNEKILWYIKRKLTHLIATVKTSLRGKKYFKLDRIEDDFHLELIDHYNLVDGDIVYVLIKEIIGSKIIGQFLEKIGHANDPNSETLKVIYHHGWPIDFDKEVIQEAENIRINWEYEKQIRKDYTNLLTITIDGADAKDLDDAISFKMTNDHYQVGIHIADVSYLVKKNSKLDLEAKKRATSLYVVNKVVPMLPPLISNGLGSLNEGEDKLCLSLIFTFDKNWKMLSYDLEKSIINSDKKLTYDEVNNLFDNNEFKGPLEIKEMLVKIYSLSKHLTKIRENHGMFNFTTNELEFIVENEVVIDVNKRELKDAEKMIENLMILANETIASHIFKLRYPMVYRIHEKPDNDKLNESIKMIQKLGFKVDTKEFSNPKTIQRLIDLAKNTRYHKIVNMLVLKSMMRAKYVNYREIHYGLNLQSYTHFTAPIRRYPDLLVHRIIHELLLSTNNFTKSFENLESNLAPLLEHASNQERLSIEISREVEKLAAIQYLNNNQDNKYKAQIISLLPSGMFIELQNGIEGFVALRNMLSYFYYFEDSLKYINDYGVEYQLGDFILVEYLGYNLERLEIDFKILKKV